MWNRILHGLTVWAFFHVVMFYLLTTTLSTPVGGGLSIRGQAVALGGSVAFVPTGMYSRGRAHAPEAKAEEGTYAAR